MIPHSWFCYVTWKTASVGLAHNCNNHLKESWRKIDWTWGFILDTHLVFPQKTEKVWVLPPSWQNLIMLTCCLRMNQRMSLCAGVCLPQWIRFVTYSKPLMHHWTLYSRVEWPSLCTQQLSHWYIFIYKATLNKLLSLQYDLTEILHQS